MKKERKLLKILKTILKIINNILTYSILICACLIFCITFYITKVLKEVNFYEIKFTLMNNLSGTGNSIFIDGIKVCLPLFIFLLLLLLIPITRFKRIKIYIETKKRQINLYPFILSKIKIIYSIFILLLSVLLLGKTINFDKYIETVTKTGDVYEMYYQNASEVQISFPEKKRNLILIYLESMESSLASKESGGTFNVSRIPELEILALNNINFSNTENLGGGYNLNLTSWTMASLWATTTGTPLAYEIMDQYQNFNEYIPNIKALGDVLKSENYNLELIQGSDRKFGGTDKYFKTHGDYKIFDLYTARERNYINKNYYKWWGFEDKKLFEYAKKEITSLANDTKPFAVSIFTMDTHFKDGYLDPSCTKNFKDQYSNVYACSSKMINNFVNWIKEQTFYENTTIVLIGDHLTMQNEYYNDYPDYTRTIYNVFINALQKPKRSKNREFSSLDMYPTILSSIGVTIEGEQLGFGINLFSNKKTMIEELGKEKFNEEISKSSNYYNQIIQE